MKTLPIVLVCALLAGCGSEGYVEQPPQSLHPKVDRALKISVGLITPTLADFIELDVAPVINGISVPDGIININDVVILTSR